MKVNKLKYGVLAITLSALILNTIPVNAEAVADTEESADAAGDVSGDAAAEGTVSDDQVSADSATDGQVVMSGIASNNGKEIALSFPESYLPVGFHKASCTYEGQTIEIAYMDNDQNGEVVLAYLADSDGSNGDFYLCDINTANMTDFVQIQGSDDKYIIILDPGDMIVPPSGFTKANLQWYGKSVTAWILPDVSDTSDSNAQDESSKAQESGIDSLMELCAGVSKPMNVYAASAGEAATTDAAAAETTATDETATDTATDTAAEAVTTSTTSEEADGSRIVDASPSDFFLVYAINQEGTVGYYLYDTVGNTYQRYVEIGTGESDTVAQYRKSAQRRLFGIAALAVLLIIAVFLLINAWIQLREYRGSDDDEDDDEDEEMEQMRRRVMKKEKTHIKTGRRELNYLMDVDEEEDDEDDENDDDENEDEEDEDEEEESFFRRPVEKKSQRSAAPQRRVVRPSEHAEERMTQHSETQRPVRRPEQRTEQRPEQRPSQRPVQRPAASQRPSRSEEEMELRPRRRPTPAEETRSVQRTSQRPAAKDAPKPTKKKQDIDDDFEFEFIDI